MAPTAAPERAPGVALRAQRFDASDDAGRAVDGVRATIAAAEQRLLLEAARARKTTS